MRDDQDYIILLVVPKVASRCTGTVYTTYVHVCTCVYIHVCTYIHGFHGLIMQSEPFTCTGTVPVSINGFQEFFIRLGLVLVGDHKAPKKSMFYIIF